MKDQTCGAPIKGLNKRLKSKMYTFIIEDNHESTRAKSINKNVIDDELRFED